MTGFGSAFGSVEEYDYFLMRLNWASLKMTTRNWMRGYLFGEPAASNWHLSREHRAMAVRSIKGTSYTYSLYHACIRELWRRRRSNTAGDKGESWLSAKDGHNV